MKNQYRTGFNDQQSSSIEAYWMERLSGFIGKTGFPFDREDLGNEAAKNDSFMFRFNETAFSRLREVSNSSDQNIFMILAAGLVFLIHKYTANEDIIIGTSIFKQEVDTEFLNTILILRNELKENVTFKELVLQVRETVIEAEKNQNYPLELLLQKLNIPLRKEENFPLFDILIIFENIQDRRYLNEIKTNFLLSFSRDRDYLTGLVEYNLCLYDNVTIRRIIDHFLNLIEIVLCDLYIQLFDIDILLKQEKERLLAEFNDTIVDYPFDKTIYEIFEEQVERTPQSTAVEFKDKKLSYRELNQRANRLARLIKRSINMPAAIVGLMVQTSLEAIIGILGVLKAGGAYLPIDPAYPEGRIHFMLCDSASDILLTTADLAYKTYFHGDNICLDDKALCEGDNKNLNRINSTNDPVYVIYTSGTTGKPKGVIIEHRGLVNYTCWAAKIYVKNEAVDFPLYTSLGFDLTITSVFTPLITGNAVLIYEGDDKASLLGEIIKDNRAGVVKLTPSHLKLLLEIPAAENSSLKRLIVGGENLESSLAREIFDHFAGKIEIFNEYGPTETVVGCMIYRFDPGKKYGRSIPIGSPADNVKIYLLDKRQKLVPTGVTGEIYISGDGVLKGYLNSPEPTSTKLFEDTFAHGTRMYRSGDLAGQLSDGNIEFLDRSDQQVKIRGYRIEPAEIETLLKQAANIKEAVVTVRAGKNSGQDRYLCAYIVSDIKQDKSELQNYLAKTLPPYMTPAYFIQLDSIPLTPNGKVNKKALPEPELSLTAQYIPPRNSVENTLTAIWSQVLDINPQKISIDANFFELGGHSLKATVLVARLYRAFKIKIPLAELFKIPTVRGLAEYIKNAKKIIYKTIDPVEKKEYYPVTSDQKRIYFMDIFDDETSPFFQSFSLKLYKKLDKARLADITRELIERHEVFRSTFEISGDNLVQIVHDDFDFEIKYIDTSPEKVNDYMAEFNKLYSLKDTPLLKVMVVSLGEAEHLLVFNMHHILSDGVSIQILGRDFRYLEQGIRLPALRIQFKDCSEWENRAINSEEMKNQEQYWLETFAAPIPVLDMPTDFPRPPIQSFAGAQLDDVLEKELRSELNRLLKDTETTLFMFIMAVFFILLAKYSGQEDIIIGTTVAGRNHSDLENMIGMLIETLAIRAFPAGEKRFIDFLIEVKTNVLNALENQDYPFKELIDKIEVRRDLSRNPLFDAMLLVQNIDIVRENTHVSGRDSDESIIDDVIKGLADNDLDEIRNIVRLPESPVDIQLTVSEVDEEIIFNLTYCKMLFRRETMERFLKHFIEIISIVSADKEIKIEDINVSHDFGKARSNMIPGERTDFIF